MPISAKLFGVAGVAAEERAVPRPCDHPRGPQRGVARENSRPEKCRAGVHTRVSSPIWWLSCQSSSTTRLSGIPTCAGARRRRAARRTGPVGSWPGQGSSRCRGGRNVMADQDRIDGGRASRGAGTSCIRSGPTICDGEQRRLHTGRPTRDTRRLRSNAEEWPEPADRQPRRGGFRRRGHSQRDRRGRS